MPGARQGYASIAARILAAVRRSAASRRRTRTATILMWTLVIANEIRGFALVAQIWTIFFR